MSKRVCIYLSDSTAEKLDDLLKVYPNYNRSSLISYLIWSRLQEVNAGVRRDKSTVEFESAENYWSHYGEHKEN